MQALRVPLHTIDRCQNHMLSGSKVRRRQLHHDYAEEKHEAWRLLGESGPRSSSRATRRISYRATT